MNPEHPTPCDSAGPDPVTLRPENARQASVWITVLEACRIDHRIEYEQDGWSIVVPAEVHTAALQEITAMEQEGDLLAEFDVTPMALSVSGRSLSSWWVAAFLLAFFVWLGPYDSGSQVLSFAASDAEALARGDWWRPITALTVHSDAVHLAGNLVCIVTLGAVACESFGPGLAWIIILGAGILGNILACLLHGDFYTSVGASTSGFAALGAIAAHRTLRRWVVSSRMAAVWKQTVLPLAAGAALVGLLGTGERSDLAAHTFGFVMGVALAILFRRAPALTAWQDRVLQMTALITVMIAWRQVFAASALY